MDSKERSVDEGGMPICPLCVQRRLTYAKQQIDANSWTYNLACLNCGAYFGVGGRAGQVEQIRLKQWVRYNDRVLVEVGP